MHIFAEELRLMSKMKFISKIAALAMLVAVVSCAGSGEESAVATDGQGMTISFRGNELHTSGVLPAVGAKAPDFELVDTNMEEIRLANFRGKKIVLNIFPSLDTDVCASSVRRFNAEAARLEDTEVICVSMDLPFAARRFCSANDIANVTTGSAFRSKTFGENYGVKLVDGPLAGLFARAIVIIDETGKVIYSAMCEELTEEPDYKAALSHLK
jgi:thiol peroxidase